MDRGSGPEEGNYLFLEGFPVEHRNLGLTQGREKKLERDYPGRGMGKSLGWWEHVDRTK